MPQRAALAQFLAVLCRHARVATASRGGLPSLRSSAGVFRALAPRQSAERLFRAKGNSPERTSRTQADRAFLLLYQCHCERAFRVHLQGKKISNLLATLPPRRRMTVDARAKQVSLLCEFPLRSSNGALNGSLIHRTRDSRAGGVLGPDTFHREARSRV